MGIRFSRRKKQRVEPPPNPQPLDHAHIYNQGIINVGPQNTVNTRDLEDRYRRARENLRALIVLNAMHTGKVRADPLECDPNTRQAIIDDTTGWVKNVNRGKPVLWIVGPAGIGKSAIAMATAERLDARGSTAKVAGSFFFFAGDADRNHFGRFVLTLAYQLAVSIADVGRKIDKAIDSDPGVLEAKIQVQWNKLIVEPIMAVSSIPPAVFIIDGLDECGTPEDQRTILRLVASCGSSFPLAFLIASRPEPHITNEFNTQSLSSCCRPHIDLSQHKDSREMRLFIRSRFSAIYHKHHHILGCDPDWPSSGVIDTITSRADGQYIYPVTLFRFIDNDDGNPQEKLDACLEEVPEALSPLDTLYLQILRPSHRPDNNEVQDLLFMACTPIPALQFNAGAELENIMTIPHLALLLFGNEKQCRFHLRRLHSVLHIPPTRCGSISIHHRSFLDFLQDPDRNTHYRFNSGNQLVRILSRCLDELEKYQRQLSYIQFLLCCWWGYSTSLPSTISEDLVSKLSSFNFYTCVDNILQTLLTTVSIRDVLEDYDTYTTLCKTWNHPLLTNKFNKDEFLGIALICTFKYQWKEIGCSPSQNCLMALAQIYIRHWKQLSLPQPVDLIEMPNMWRNVMAINSLLLLISISQHISTTLLKDDMSFLQSWSHALGVPLRDLELNQKYNEELLWILHCLPKEYHYHQLNAQNITRWLEEYYEDEASLASHWKEDTVCQYTIEKEFSYALQEQSTQDAGYFSSDIVQKQSHRFKYDATESFLSLLEILGIKDP